MIDRFVWRHLRLATVLFFGGGIAAAAWGTVASYRGADGELRAAITVAWITPFALAFARQLSLLQEDRLIIRDPAERAARRARYGRSATVLAGVVLGLVVGGRLVLGDGFAVPLAVAGGLLAAYAPLALYIAFAIRPDGESPSLAEPGRPKAG